MDWLYPKLRESWLPRYAIAVALFLVSFGLAKLLNLWLFPDRGFVFFLPATVLAAFIAGLLPAILTAVLSAGAAWYFFIPPVHSFDVGLKGLVGLGTFVFAAAVSVGVIHRLRAALQNMRRAETIIASDLFGMTRLNQLSNELVREGVREDSKLVNLQCFGEKIAALRFFHQGCGHLTLEVRVAPGFVVERVEDCKGGWTLLNGEPGDRSRFSIH